MTMPRLREFRGSSHYPAPEMAAAQTEIEGVKKQLAHQATSIERIEAKIDKVLYVVLGGMGTVLASALALLGTIAYTFILNPKLAAVVLGVLRHP